MTIANATNGGTAESLTPGPRAPKHRWMRWAFVGLIALASSACTKPNPALCCTSQADCDSVGVKASEKLCSDGLACVAHTCVLAPDGGNSQCVSNTDCSSPTPYCGPGRTCVECVSSDQCPATAPVCDDTSHTCTTCTMDSQCASQVCDLDAGTCVADASILYASPTGADTTTCTSTDPCSLTHAIALVDTTRNTIKMAAGMYSANLVISKSMLIDGFGATVVGLSNNGAAALEVANGAAVRVLGLGVTDLTAHTQAILCDRTSGSTMTPQLELREVSTDSQNYAVFTNPCVLTISESRMHIRVSSSAAIACISSSTATIDRTLVDGGDGVQSSQSIVHVTNSVIANQGPDGALSGGFVFGPAGALYVSFSTIVNSVVKASSDTPVCAGGTGVGVCIDNSIIMNALPGAPTDSVSGSGAILSYSIVFPQSSAVTGSNNLLGVDPLLANPSSGDDHLRAGSPAIDAADPAASDPLDFDGTVRPQGTRRDIGAFEYH